MRERKTVVIPVEVLDDPRLTLSDIGLLGEILRNQFRFSKITTANLKSVLKETEKTIRKGLVRLTESGYLIKDSRNNGWLLDSGKIYGNERENLPEQTVKSPETKGKISLCKKEHRHFCRHISSWTFLCQSLCLQGIFPLRGTEAFLFFHRLHPGNKHHRRAYRNLWTKVYRMQTFGILDCRNHKLSW